MIRYIISKMMGAEGLLMLLPMMVGIIYGEHTSVYFLITAAILTAIYLLFGRKCPENMTIYAKEGLIKQHSTEKIIQRLTELVR